MPEIKILSKDKKITDEIVPSLVTGAAGNDPAGIATYALSGIRFGFGQLWLLLLTTPMLIAVLSMVGRIAIVTKKGLSANLRTHFSQKVALVAVALLVAANVLTIGADIAAMAEAFALLVPGTELVHWVVPVSFLIWYVVVFFNYKEIRKYFMWLILIFAAFVISAILASPDWRQVFGHLFIPRLSFDKIYLMSAVALIGTTISPYMLYWEARETIEEKTPSRFASLQHLVQTPGFLLSNFISFMIIVSTGSLLFGQINGDITAVQIARALEPVAGQYATAIFALGIIGAGFVAVPVLAASAALGLTGALGWKEGLSLKPTSAKGFYEVISIAMLIGVQIAISGFDPVKALFLSQVVTGLLAPPLFILVFILANSKSVMGRHTNGWFDNIFGGLAILILLGASIGLILSL